MGNISHNTGNVGIGTASPLVPLDVRGGSVRVDRDGTFEQSVAFNTTTGGWARGMYFYDSRATNTLNPVGLTGAIGMFGSGASPSSIFIGHGDTPWAGTNSIHLLRNGNVGIGTDNPATKLDVNGVARFGAGTFPQIKKVEYIPTFTTNSVKDTDNFYFVVYGFVDSGPTPELSTILSDFTSTVYTSIAPIAAAQNGGVAGGTVGALKYTTKINPLTISITPRFNTSKLLVKFKVSCSEPHTVDASGTSSEGDCGFIITRSIDGGAETLVGIPAAAITSALTRGVFHSVIAVTVKENSASDDLCQTEIEYLDEDGAAQSWGGKTVTYSIRIYGKEGPGVPINTQRIFLGRGKDDNNQGDDSRALSYSIIQEYFE